MDKDQDPRNSLKGLCDYSSSSEEEHSQIIKKKPPDKRKICVNNSSTKKLNVPSSIKSMFKETDAILNGPPPTSLDVSKHQQRVRTFPHTRGNWATTVFIKVPENINDEIKQIQIWLSSKINDIWKRRYLVNLQTIHIEEDPHISLTKVGVTLQLHWINDFTTTLKDKLKGLKSSYASFGKFQMFMNESKTRIFVGLQTFADEFTKYVGIIDGVLQEFGQPIFYETPKFHTSLLWCLPISNEENRFLQNQDSLEIDSNEERFEVIIKELNKEFQVAIDNNEIDSNGFWVSAINAKIGNKSFKFELDG